MKHLWLGAVAIAICGCGARPEDRVLGTWHVDAATVQTSRLVGGTSSSPDWTDATASLADVRVEFRKQTVTASGFGLKSEGTWSLSGNAIQTIGSGDSWPAMTFDSRGPRIHASITKGADQLQFDLVRS